jgi:MazG family protein
LLQVVFHAQMASEEKRFDFDGVAQAIVEKLVRRHPHVFGSENASDSAAVLARWEEIKRAEKGAAAENASALDGVSEGLPGLMRAEKVQKKAAKVGFDWSETPPIIGKIREELIEVENAVARGDQAAIEDEVGDLLFAAVNLARRLKIDGEVALQRATDKFSTRFRGIEALARDRGLVLEKMTLAEMDQLWDEVKGKRSPPPPPPPDAVSTRTE